VFWVITLTFLLKIREKLWTLLQPLSFGVGIAGAKTQKVEGKILLEKFNN
jgi:hypothetical protein